VESWFKAELLVLFEQLKSQRLIESFEREPNLRIGKGREKVDFIIRIRAVEHLCELKAVCISQAMGTPRDLSFYFREDKFGLINDFKKLDQIVGDNKWAIAFIYPKPSESEWQEVITSLPENVRHWQCVINIEDYPEYFFIALWSS
jgi:hypothetical protein